MNREQLRCLTADAESIHAMCRTREFLWDAARVTTDGVHERVLRETAEALDPVLRKSLRDFAVYCRRGSLQG